MRRRHERRHAPCTMQTLRCISSAVAARHGCWRDSFAGNSPRDKALHRAAPKLRVRRDLCGRTDRQAQPPGKRLVDLRSQRGRSPERLDYLRRARSCAHGQIRPRMCLVPSTEFILQLFRCLWRARVFTERLPKITEQLLRSGRPCPAIRPVGAARLPASLASVRLAEHHIETGTQARSTASRACKQGPCVQQLLSVPVASSGAWSHWLCRGVRTTDEFPTGCSAPSRAAAGAFHRLSFPAARRRGRACLTAAAGA